MTIRICAALAVVLSTLPGFALDDPLALFPKETGLVVRASSTSELTKAAQAFLQNAAPRYVAIANQIGAGMGSLVENPTLQGVDPARDWYLAVNFKAEQRPQVIFAIPVQDAEAMKSALGESMYSRGYDGWLVYSQDQSAIKALSAEPLPEKKSIQASMDETVTKLFAEGNLSLFVNVPVLRRIYEKQIEDFKKQIQQRVKEATIRDNPGLQSSIAASRTLFDMALAAFESAEGLAVSVTIRQDAVLANTVFVVEPDSEAGQFLAKQEASDFSLLKKLPAGWMAYYAAGGSLDKIVELSLQMSQAGLKDNKEAQATMKELLAHGLETTAGALIFDQAAEGAFRFINISRVGSAEDYLADYRAFIKQLGHIESNGVQQDTRLKAEAETIAGVPVDVVRTMMTFDPKSDPTGMASRLITIMFGEQGIVQRVALIEDLLLQSTGGGQEQMKMLLQATKGDGGETSAATALAQLQENIGDSGQLFLAYDLPRLAKSFLGIMLESGLAPLPPAMGDAVEDVELETSYGGLLVEIEDNRLWFREVFPAEQAAGLVKLGTAIQQATRQRN